MGCSLSSLFFLRSKRKVRDTNEVVKFGDSTLNQRQQKIIRNTWKKLEPDMTKIGIKIFLRIYTCDPRIKVLFPCKDLEGDELLSDSHLKAHASRFMQIIKMIVDNIGNVETVIEPVVLDRGKQHLQIIGFRSEYFDNFSEAMLHIWNEELRTSFTEQAKEAWSIVFEYIMSKLQEGYNTAAMEEEVKYMLKNKC